MVLAAGFALALATFSTSCLFCWATRANELGPPAGVAPAGSLYKSEPQAAAWRRKWSQSPVLPRTRRAYETHVSAGSTAVLHSALSGLYSSLNGAPTRSCTELTCLPSERITENALGALEIGVPDRLRSGDLLDENQAC